MSTNTLSAILIGVVNVVIRSLKGLHFAVAAGFQAILTFSASLVVLVIYRTMINTEYDYSTFNGEEIFLIILNGLVQCLMQIAWIQSLFLDKAGRAASLTFIGIVLGYISDYITFDYHMNAMELLGATLIVGCSVIVFALKIFNFSH